MTFAARRMKSDVSDRSEKYVVADFMPRGHAKYEENICQTSMA